MQVFITDKKSLISKISDEKIKESTDKIIVLSNNSDNYNFTEVNELLKTGVKIEFLPADNEIEIAFILGKICADKKDTDNINISLSETEKYSDNINNLFAKYINKNKLPTGRKKRTVRNKADESKETPILEIEKVSVRDKNQKEQKEKEKEIKNKEQKPQVKDSYYIEKLSKYIRYNSNSGLEEREFYNRIADCFKNDYQDIVQYGLLKGKFEKEIAEEILVQIKPKAQMIRSICKAED